MDAVRAGPRAAATRLQRLRDLGIGQQIRAGEVGEPRLQGADAPVAQGAHRVVGRPGELLLQALAARRVEQIGIRLDARQRLGQRARGGAAGVGLDPGAGARAVLDERRPLPAEAHQQRAAPCGPVRVLERAVELGVAADLGAQPLLGCGREALRSRGIDVLDRQPRTVAGAALAGAGEVAQAHAPAVAGGELQQQRGWQPARRRRRPAVQPAGVEGRKLVRFDVVVAPVEAQQDRPAVERGQAGAGVVPGPAVHGQVQIDRHGVAVPPLSLQGQVGAGEDGPAGDGVAVDRHPRVRRPARDAELQAECRRCGRSHAQFDAAAARIVGDLAQGDRDAAVERRGDLRRAVPVEDQAVLVAHQRPVRHHAESARAVDRAAVQLRRSGAALPGVDRVRRKARAVVGSVVGDPAAGDGVVGQHRVQRAELQLVGHARVAGQAQHLNAERDPGDRAAGLDRALRVRIAGGLLD